MINIISCIIIIVCEQLILQYVVYCLYNYNSCFFHYAFSETCISVLNWVYCCHAVMMELSKCGGIALQLQLNELDEENNYD